MKKLLIFVALVLGLAACDFTTRGNYSYALMLKETRTGKTWQASFKQLNGTYENTMKTGKTGNAIVILSEIEDGGLYFTISERDGAEIAKIEANRGDTIAGLNPSTRYQIEVAAQKARGKFEIKVIEI